MKKGHIRILILEIILLIFLLFNSFVFKISDLYFLTGILFPIMLLSVLFFGMEKDTFRNKKDVFLNIIIYVLAYYFITYFIGFFTGFVRSSYSFTISNIIKNALPSLLLILVSEILRYVIVHKSSQNKLCLILGYIVFVLIDMNTMLHLYDMSTYVGLTKMICLVVFPSITKNILLLYLTLKSGYKNAIFYRLVTELTTYIFPIFPDFGEYLNVMVETVLPIIIMVKLNNLFNYFDTRQITTSRYNNKKMIFYSFVTAMLLIIVTLTSGYFKYQALTIGSNSMAPKIQKGDIVILKKVKDKNDIKKGNILVYNHDNKIIVHRVTKKINMGGKTNFITKGDNNNNKDAYVVNQEEVIGIVVFKVKYIGMPTVALNELLNG